MSIRLRSRVLSIPLLAAALPCHGLAQDFEQDLRPPAHQSWFHAGAAVDIAGDWAVVDGEILSPSGSNPLPEDLPALFRRDATTGEWAFHQSLVQPNRGGYGSERERVAIDERHVLLGAVDTNPFRPVVDVWRFDPVAGTWTSRLPLVAPNAGATTFGEVVALDGDHALVSEPGSQSGAVHRFEYDATSDMWSFAETLVSPTGAGSFGTHLDIDGGTAVIGELIFGMPGPAQLHVYEAGPNGWSHSQSIQGGMGGAAPSSLFGLPVALDGDLLAFGNFDWPEVHRRAGPGMPFVFEGSFTLGANQIATSIDVEGETIVIGERYANTGGAWQSDGRVDVFRRVACLGAGWQRTHTLHTAHRHNADVALGGSIAISGDQVVVGMPEYRFVNGPFHGWSAGAASVFRIRRDCNGNGVEDACEIAAGEEDVDGDGVLDECEAVGRRYCSPGNTTILGAAAYVLLQGSDVAARDRVFFTFVGVPPGAPGLMLASRQAGFAANPAGSRGDLCLGEPIGRFAGRTHSFWFAGGDGVISQRYPLMSTLPGGGPMLAGETWFFQGWFREAGSSNFTDGIQLLMR